MSVTFEHTVLPNGLTVVAEVDASALTSAAGFFVKTGAGDESPDIMGVSHFLEHMMFKGTARRTAADLNREFDELGARNNAYTSAEMTCFHAAVLPEELGNVLDLLSDMMRPALREEDFQRERAVILEEIAMYKDNPFWVLYEQTTEHHYGAHPLAHRVLGTEITIGRLAREQMVDYFTKRYSADNTVLALAGKVDFDRVVKQIESMCGGWSRSGAARAPAPPTPADQEFTVRDAKITRAYQLIMAPAPSMEDDRRYPAAVFASLMGSADNSRLHWSLIEPGIAEEAEFAFDPRDDAGEFMVYLVTDPARADEAWSVVEKELATWRKNVAQQDVQRVGAKLATAVTLAGERPDGRMQRLGRQWTYLGRYTTLEEELDRLRQVTLDDVERVFSQFPLRPRTWGKLLPQ